MKFEHYDLLLQMVAEGFVNAQTRTKPDLTIYNYTPRAQYSRTWNEATMAARGLILEEAYAASTLPERPDIPAINLLLQELLLESLTK